MNDVIEKPIKPDRLCAVLTLVAAQPEDGAIAAADLPDGSWGRDRTADLWVMNPPL